MKPGELESLVATVGREALGQIQLRKAQLMISDLLQSNRYYQRKFGSCGLKRPEEISTLSDWNSLPFTTRVELSLDQASHPPYGTNLTFDRSRYIRVHHTSGSRGEPLRCLDTAESWEWWKKCWATVYRAAGVTSMDRIFLAFSFGPFIGFWSAFEGAQTIGSMALPGGGMSSHQRVRAIVDNDISVVICTPTYALHLVEVAAQEGIDLTNSNVRVTIHAGEPGASIPATKLRIEEQWGARCYDHAGATEVGAWGFECLAQNGLHLNEGEFIFEVIDPVTEQPAEEGELVITNLGRIGMPVVRYRTGDHVRLASGACGCGRSFQRLEGGVTGRVDDAIIIRGVNVFPSAIENIVRKFQEVGEFSVDCYRRGTMDEMEIRIEVAGVDGDSVASALARELRHALNLRVRVQPAPFGTLPRYDLKTRRFTDHRTAAPVKHEAPAAVRTRRE